VLATSEASNAISAERNRDGTAIEYLRALLRNTDSETDRGMSIIDVCFQAGSEEPAVGSTSGSQRRVGARKGKRERVISRLHGKLHSYMNIHRT